jgi:indole-3-glycerol phosphate synthase
VNTIRRFSQAISEGDGISLLVPVDDAGSAAAAEARGAEGVVVVRRLDGLRESTGLPVFSRAGGAPRAAVDAGADAWLMWVENADDEDELRDLYTEARNLGLEPVVGVRDDEELELALEQLDPEIFLLAPPGEDGDPLEQVLDLLPDVPAGKLAIAELPVRSDGDVIALERAGVDAVIVSAADVERLAGGSPPDVV